jgi:hypothetical protein
VEVLVGENNFLFLIFMREVKEMRYGERKEEERIRGGAVEEFGGKF